MRLTHIFSTCADRAGDEASPGMLVRIRDPRNDKVKALKYTLETLGFGQAEQAQLQDAPLTSTQHPARISRVDRGQAEALTTAGDRVVRLSINQAPVAVGDWVIVSGDLEGAEPLKLERALTRRGALTRAAAGTSTKQQLIASNIDTLFIVTSMNSDFSPSRLERYLLAAWQAGANPVIVLSKADLTNAPEHYIEQAQQIGMGVPIITTSVVDGALGAKPLYPHLGPGKTCALVGSSGVGKTSLINALRGPNKLELPTSHIRSNDETGRHTTTWRSLIVLDEDRGLILDTPGMRELSLWASEDTLAEAFEDVEELAQRCRFRDCQHHDEPGCAVQEALSTGQLKPRRLASYQKLQRELHYQEIRQDEAARRQQVRDFAKKVKQIQRFATKRK